MQSCKLTAPRATGIHDLEPAPDGGVWFTAKASGHLGWFDPKTGRTAFDGAGDLWFTGQSGYVGKVAV